MQKEGQLDEDELAALEKEVAALLDRAVETADQAPEEPVEDLTRFVVSPAGGE